MKKDIAKVLSSCTEDELDSLLKDNVNVPLDSNIKERIKKSVFEKTGIKQKKKNTKLRRAVIISAALVAAEGRHLKAVLPERTACSRNHLHVCRHVVLEAMRVHRPVAFVSVCARCTEQQAHYQ